MSRRCELSGVGVSFGHKVSHSQIKTNRKFKPNLRKVSLHSNSTGEDFKFKVNNACLRSVEKVGGLDEYIMKVSVEVLSDNAKKVRRKIIQKKGELV